MDATSQKQGLQKLMRSRAPDSSLKDVARALFGLYVNIARDCAWPLVPASKLDASDLAKRLSSVLAVPVNEVRFISISAPYADAEWTTDEGYVALFEEGLAAGLERSVERDFPWTYWGRLQLSTERRLVSGIGEERLDILERDVRDKIMPGLRQALFSTLAGPLSVRSVEECVYGVETTLHAFLAYTIMDDRADGVPLGRVVRLMTGAIPLGAKIGEPGTWTVLTA